MFEIPNSPGLRSDGLADAIDALAVSFDISVEEVEDALAKMCQRAAAHEQLKERTDLALCWPVRTT